MPAVLLVEGHLRENGGLRVTLTHARHFRELGAPVVLAVLQDSLEEPRAQPDPALDVRVLSPVGTRFRSAAAGAFLRLLRLARRADVVVAGSEIGNGLLFGFLAARLAHRPFAVLVQSAVDTALRDWVPPRLHGVTRWVLAHADAAVCVADSVVPGLLAAGLPAERARVVVNGVDVAAVRERAGLPPVPSDGAEHSRADDGRARPVVVANGRLSTLKNFTGLVRAHRAVLDAGLDHELVIMGEGPQRAEIEDAVREAGVAGSVALPGFSDNPYPRIATADLFVLSSLSEGMPLTLLEALAVGAPVVATACGGGPELLLDGGRYGDLVPPGSEEALAEAIERHLRDPGRLRAKAASGPARALRFDAGRAAATVLGVLAELSGLAAPDLSRTAGLPSDAVGG